MDDWRKRLAESKNKKPTAKEKARAEYVKALKENPEFAKGEMNRWGNRWVMRIVIGFVWLILIGSLAGNGNHTGAAIVLFGGGIGFCVWGIVRHYNSSP